MRTASALLALCAALTCLASHARASGRSYNPSGFNGAAGQAYIRTFTDATFDNGMFEPGVGMMEAWDFVEKKRLWTVEADLKYFVDSKNASVVRTLGYDQTVLHGPDGFARTLVETYDAATGAKIGSELFFEGRISEVPVVLPSGEIFAVTYNLDDPSTGSVQTGVQTFSQPSGKKFVAVEFSDEEGENPNTGELAASPVDNVVYYPYSLSRPLNRVSRYDASGDEEAVTVAVGELLDQISIYGTADQKDHMFVYGTRAEDQDADLVVSATKVSKDLNTIAWTYTAHLSADGSSVSATPVGFLYVEGYVVFLVRLFVDEGVGSTLLKNKNSGQSLTVDLVGLRSMVLLFLDAESGDMKRAVSRNPADSVDNWGLTDNPVFYSAESETIVLAGFFSNESGSYWGVSDIDIEGDLDALGVPQC